MKLPVQPVFSCDSFGGGTGAPSLLDAGEIIYLNRGSLAIGHALTLMDLEPGSEVLLPAYHCPAMVEPVVWAGFSPVFYRIHADTSADLEDLGNRIGPSSRVMLVPHYFGFPQEMGRIRAFCDRHGLLLIEDCAHAFFGECSGHPVGFHGDYAVGSAWKFFPVNEGACLVSSRHALPDKDLQSGGLFFELKSVLNTLEHSVEYGRLGMLNFPAKTLLGIKDWLWKVMKNLDEQGEDTGKEEYPASGFDGKRVRQRISLASKRIIESSSKSRIVERRRSNYLRLQSALECIDGGRPLFGALPEKVVPHVFPFLVDRLEAVFQRLKSAGVPVIRFGEYLWKDMERGTCPVSEEYSRRVFQFPCHQDLSGEDIDWMIGRIRAALGYGEVVE